MKKTGCFLSCSFRVEDRGVVAYFKDLLEEYFDVLTAEVEKIFPKIRNSSIYFAIFSKRNKVENADDWTPPPDTLTEAGFAHALTRKVYGFVESGISEQQLGLFRSCSTNYPRFNRNTFEADRRKFSGYIKAAAEELSKIIWPPWEYTQIIKEVTVYQDGYGVIRNQVGLEFNKHQSQAVLDHFLSGGESAKKGYVLPHLEDMRVSGHQARKHSNYFFAASIVKGGVSDDALRIEETSHSPNQLGFNIKICGSFERASVLAYEWCVGMPEAFPVTHEDLKSGKRVQDMDDALSTLKPRTSNRNTQLMFVLRFEKPICFAREPVFRVLSMNGDLLVEKSNPPDVEIQNSALYIVYVCKFPLGNPYTQVVAQWRPA